MSYFNGTLDSSRLNWDSVPLGPASLNYVNTARRTPTFAATGKKSVLKTIVYLWLLNYFFNKKW